MLEGIDTDEFQSAPLTEARGDAKGRYSQSSRKKFQSAPLTEARGDSAHSLSISRLLRFQSAPLTEARGDRCRRQHRRPLASVSIRSPHRSKGRLLCTVVMVIVLPVSIRSPHRSKGRPAKANSRSCPVVFQSAPLTEARGDHWICRPRRPARRFNPLPSPKQGETHPQAQQRAASSRFNPLPSPKQGETACPALVIPPICVSIRSPHRSKGRRVTSVRPNFVPMSFNPLPSPKQGETVSQLRCANAHAVSIRSPHRSKGRRL